MPALSLTTRLLLCHGLVAWPLVRALFALALLMTLSPPLPVGGIVSLGVICGSVVVAMLAMRRRAERVLLADEPLRGISPIDQERILDAFRALASTGCAVVVTGHDVEALLEGADHVTWCTSGTTYELGAPARARAHEAFSREYLGRS